MYQPHIHDLAFDLLRVENLRGMPHTTPLRTDRAQFFRGHRGASGYDEVRDGKELEDRMDTPHVQSLVGMRARLAGLQALLR